MLKLSVTLLSVAIVLSTGSLCAQDLSGIEVFGGYSVRSRVRTGGGWQAGVAANVNSSIGIVGDLAGHYETGKHFNIFEYMGGPRLSLRRKKATVFAHALLGGTHIERRNASGPSENSFSMGYGGGVDWNIRHVAAVRVVQFDWIPVRFGGNLDTSIFRLGFGLVFKISPK